MQEPRQMIDVVADTELAFDQFRDARASRWNRDSSVR